MARNPSMLVMSILMDNLHVKIQDHSCQRYIDERIVENAVEWLRKNPDTNNAENADKLAAAINK
ncbi:MAG: hypothetical protein WA364_08750 [Candidatus Nitrosopolaris sp.]